MVCFICVWGHSLQCAGGQFVLCIGSWFTVRFYVMGYDVFDVSHCGVCLESRFVLIHTCHGWRNLCMNIHDLVS